MNNLNFISPRDLEKNNILIHNVDTNNDAVVNLGSDHDHETMFIGTIPINNFYNYADGTGSYRTMDGCPIVILTCQNDNWINLSYWNKDTLTYFIQNGSPVIVYCIIPSEDENLDISNIIYSKAEIVNSIDIENNSLHLFSAGEEEIYIDASGQISTTGPEPVN